MPLEPETDISTSAIMWLLDDPTFSPDHRATISEVLKSLGAEDPDDPLTIALVQEGVREARGAPVHADTPTGWQPELCGEDAKRRACNEPVSGTGRCMTCGSQRIEPEKPSSAIKAAQMSDKEPDEVAFLEIEDGQGESGEAAPVSEPVLPLDAAPVSGKAVSPRPDAPVRRKAEKPLKLTAIKVTNFNKTFDPPDQNAVQRRLDQMIEDVRGDLPLTLRLKRIAGLSDEEIGAFINRSRATVQAYAQDNRREILDAEQIKVLRSVLELRRDMVTDLLTELEALQCPSES